MIQFQEIDRLTIFKGMIANSIVTKLRVDLALAKHLDERQLLTEFDRKFLINIKAEFDDYRA